MPPPPRDADADPDAGPGDRSPRRRGRRARAALVIPAALASLLVLEGFVAAGAEYLVDVDYVVARVVDPSGGASPTGEPPLRLWVLGDSTAAGVGAASEAGSLPVQIARRVAAATDRSVAVAGLGVSGARTLDVAREQAAALPAGDGEVDVVVVAVGSNDVVHATPWWQVEDRTAAMLDGLAARTDAPLVIAGVPRFAGVGALPQPLRGVVDRYAGVVRSRQRRAVRSSSQATYVDIASLASPRFIAVPEAMASDAFHPSEVGYGFWADAIAPHVVRHVRAGAGDPG